MKIKAATTIIVLFCMAVFFSRFAVYDMAYASGRACGMDIRGIAIDSKNPEIIYALNGRIGHHGIYKSTDGGGNWNALNGFVDERGYLHRPSASLAIDPKNPQIIYADDFKSINGGKTWSHMRDELKRVVGAITRIIIHPHDAKILYLQTSNREFFKSIDCGESWAAIGDKKLGGARIFALDPNNPSVLYGYFFREDEDGPGRTITYDSFGPSEYGMKGEIFKSVDGGTVWTSSLLPVTGITGLAVDPNNSAIIYAGTTRPNPRFPDGAAASKSAVKPAKTGQGIYRSTNGGRQWNFIKFDLPEESSVTNSFAFDPVTPGRIYVGTSRGIFISDDRGNNWRNLTGFPKISVRELAINPQKPAIIYAVTTQSGIYKTIDRGKTWNPVNITGIPVLPSCFE